jgi:chemotaxis protein MotB
MSQELANVQTDLSSARSQLQTQEDTAQQRSDQLETLQKQALETLQEAITNGSVVVEPQPRGLLLRVGGSVLFSGGQASIRSAGRATLDAITEFIQMYPDYQVRVEGHTDSLPVSSNSRWASNWELSTARASAAVRYLESKGIDVNRISAGGYAEHRPLGDNKTPEGRAQNRRIEIVLVVPPTTDASQ